MGFFTIWFTSSFCLIGLSSLLSYIYSNLNVYGRVYNITTRFFIYRAISWAVFLLIALFYPEFFIYYLIGKLQIPFFITDANQLAFNLFRNILFFSWIFYFPFISLNFFYIQKNVFIPYENRISRRFIYYLVYFHIFAIVVVHFDIIYFIQYYFESAIGSWFDMMDYSTYLITYRGNFFDLWYILILFSIALNIYLEFNKYSHYSENTFWNNFIICWTFRVFKYRFAFYFFIGEGSFSNMLVALLSLFSRECFLLYFRVSFKLSSWKGAAKAHIG